MWGPELVLPLPPEDEIRALLQEFTYQMRVAETIVDGAASMMAAGEPLRRALGPDGQRTDSAPAVMDGAKEAFVAVKRVMTVTRHLQRLLKRRLNSWVALNRSELALLGDDPVVPAA